METTEKENLNLIILLSRWMPTEYFSYLSTPFILWLKGYQTNMVPLSDIDKKIVLSKCNDLDSEDDDELAFSAHLS